MPAISPQISAMKDWRTKFINMVADLLPQGNLPPPPGNMPVTEPGTWKGAAQSALGFLVPQPEDTLIAPTELRPNFRSPEQIQALRRMMAEEQRARGPLNRIQETYGNKVNIQTPTGPLDFPSMEAAQEWLQLSQNRRASSPEWANLSVTEIPQYRDPDPIDQILRGSWYHGMSEKARNKLPIPQENLPSIQEMKDLLFALPHTLQKDIFKKLGIDFNLRSDFNEVFGQVINNNDLPMLSHLLEYNKYTANKLPEAFNVGFPLSAHDAQSISNKLGEPAGVSLSLNPTVSSKFSADPNIFRVMPLYGGPPTERTVNLMTSQGRNALNDAYDVVINNWLQRPEYSSAAREYFGIPKSDRLSYGMMENPTIIDWIENYAFPKHGSGLGQFNQQLSNQLQNQGYRHILYNPQRWNEYEMLALDPKYALPLDYRPLENYREPMYDYANKKNTPWYVPATPQAQKGLENIQDLMSQNASRLGDIYNERSWWDRLNEGIKDVLLRDNPQAEQIIQKLKGGT